MINKIESAFNRFDAGERPPNYKKPKSWYIHRVDDRLYPLKAIWALATNKSTNDFNTNEATKELALLGYRLVKAFDA